MWCHADVSQETRDAYVRSRCSPARVDRRDPSRRAGGAELARQRRRGNDDLRGPRRGTPAGHQGHFAHPPVWVVQFLHHTSAGRIGAPGDVAYAVSVLAALDAGFITGQRLLVDGGRSLTV